MNEDFKSPPATEVKPDHADAAAEKNESARIDALKKETSRSASGALESSLKAGAFAIESIDSSGITPEMTDEISDYFRYIFITDFPEYVVCQPCGVSSPAYEVFGLGKGEHVSLADADGLREFPDCAGCGKKMEFLHDPGRTREKIRAKLKENAFFTSIRPAQGGPLEGFTFGYKTTLRNAFDNEWGHPYGYTKKPAPGMQRDEKKFFDDVGAHISAIMSAQAGKPVEVTPESEMICWNCTVIGPGVRKAGLLPLLTQQFFKSLPPADVESLCAVGEAFKGSRYHKILEMAGGRSFHDLIGSDHVIVAGSLREGARRFAMSEKAFKQNG